MRCGQFDRGIAILREVLMAHGIRVPRSLFCAMVVTTLLFLRVLLTRLPPRPAGRAPRSAELEHVDICWAVYLGVLNADSFLAQPLGLQASLAAFRTREPGRCAQFMGLRATFIPIFTGRIGPRSARLFAQSQELARTSGHPMALAWTLSFRAMTSVLAGDFADATERVELAIEAFRAEAGAAFESLAGGYIWKVWSLFPLGRLREAATVATECLRDAGDRGDLHGTIFMQSGLGCLATLLPDDRPGDVIAQVTDARRRWYRKRFDLQHALGLVAHLHALLYQGHADEAVVVLAAARPGIRSSGLIAWSLFRVWLRDLEGRIALSVCASLRRDSRRKGLRQAAQAAARLFRGGNRSALPAALLLRAGCDRLAGNDDLAITHLRAAVAAFDERAMSMHAAMARLRLSALVGGAEAEAIAAPAHAWIARENIKNPAGFLRMLAPGFDPA